jgi:hypothetical protein
MNTAPVSAARPVHIRGSDFDSAARPVDIMRSAEEVRVALFK